MRMPSRWWWIKLMGWDSTGFIWGRVALERDKERFWRGKNMEYRIRWPGVWTQLSHLSAVLDKYLASFFFCKMCISFINTFLKLQWEISEARTCKLKNSKHVIYWRPVRSLAKLCGLFSIMPSLQHLSSTDTYFFAPCVSKFPLPGLWAVQ